MTKRHPALIRRASIVGIAAQLVAMPVYGQGNSSFRPLLNTGLPLPDLTPHLVQTVAGSNNANKTSATVDVPLAKPAVQANKERTKTVARIDSEPPKTLWMETVTSDHVKPNRQQEQAPENAEEPLRIKTTLGGGPRPATPAVEEQPALRAEIATTSNASASSPTEPQTAVAETAAAPRLDMFPNSVSQTSSVADKTEIALSPPSPANTFASPERLSSQLIFIDNDEAIEQEASIKYEDLPLDQSGTKVKVGARFPIVIQSEITSKTAKEGDAVLGRLKYDLKVGDRLVAPKGAHVRGHLNYVLPARTPMRSLVSTNRWYRNSGCLGVTFDEIINHQGEHIPLVAEPARQALYVKNKGEGRELGINHHGQITGPWSKQLEYKAVRIGLNAAFSATGAFSFGAMPVVLGCIGAANPSFAFMKPVGTNVRHRRVKGFFWGALSGVPGSWLIEDTTIKGQEAIIKPGDEFLAEMRQEFTGEPASEAELSGADTKVRGELVKKKKS